MEGKSLDAMRVQRYRNRHPERCANATKTYAAKNRSLWNAIIDALWPSPECIFCGKLIEGKKVFHHFEKKNINIAHMKKLPVTQERLWELSLVDPAHRSCHINYHRDELQEARGF